MTVENRKDPYTQMLQIQQSVAKTLRKSGVGIGKILSPPPNIQIAYNGFILDKYDVFVDEYWVAGHERNVKGTLSSATQNRSGGSGDAMYESHNHDIANPYTENLIYTDTYKPGDYVKVEPIEASDEMGTSQQYLISGKFIRLDGK